MKYEQRMNQLHERLKEAEFVVTTADIWTGFRKSRAVLAMTVTYIDNAFQRQTFALACRVFEGSDTREEIAKILHDEHEKSGLSVPNLVATVTGNAPNFRKAFRELGLRLDFDEGDKDEWEDNSAGGSHQEEEEESMIPEVPMEDLFDIPSVSGSTLPPLYKSPSHIMSLVCINALKTAEAENDTFKGLHRSLMSKVTALCETHPLVSSASALRTLERHFVTPCPTRWNSLYDTFRFIEQQNSALLDQVFEEFVVEKLISIEWQFLTELLEALKPVASALDHLQSDGERGALGYLIPRIYELNDQLSSELPKKAFVYVNPLIAALKDQLHQQYGNLIRLDLEDKEVQNCVLATVTQPKFKLYWCVDDDAEEAVRQFVMSFANQNSNVPPVSLSEPDREEEFGFMAKRQRTAVSERRSHTQLQIMQYLADERKELNSLDSFPLVKKMFLRFNARQTSSADVERLFSAGAIQAGRRSRLYPCHLQRLLFLKSAMNL